ncbi:MAG: hypothetical protein Q8Q14_01815 [Gemmatimonadales bacterium]|nr:hypothetical protein [Gemmatimonadales bacterium]
MKSMLSGGNIERFKRAALRARDRGIELIPWNEAELAANPDATPIYVLHDPGCDHYQTTCGGSCEVSHLTNYRHLVDCWWDARTSCEPCPSRVECAHLGAAIEWDGFRWPDPPSAETLLRLVDAGRAILAEEGTDPALKVARLRGNYEALATQAVYLVGGRAAHDAPPPEPEVTCHECGMACWASEVDTMPWHSLNCSRAKPAPTPIPPPRRVSQAARERAETRDYS